MRPGGGGRGGAGGITGRSGERRWRLTGTAASWVGVPVADGIESRGGRF